SYELGETRVMMPLEDRLTATYVTREARPAVRSELAIPIPQYTPEQLAEIERAKQRPVPHRAAVSVPDAADLKRSRELMIWRGAVVALIVLVLILLLAR